MIYAAIVSSILLLAFAYCILALSSKEAGFMKMAGVVLGSFVVLFALIVLYLGAAGKGGHGMISGCPMMSKDGGKEMEGKIYMKHMMNKKMDIKDTDKGTMNHKM